MPKDIPFLTTELYVDNNNIKTIQSSMMKALVRLKIMDLSWNDIQYLEEESFPNLPKLATLLLNNNKYFLLNCIIHYISITSGYGVFKEALSKV